MTTVIIVLLLVSFGCQRQAKTGEEEAPGGEAALPEDSLPFPKEQVRNTWDVGGGYVLVERAENLDRSFYLYDEATDEADRIVWFIENATYTGEKDGYLHFIARGGDDTGNFAFPYLLRYHMASGGLQRETMFVPAERPVAFGKPGWKQVLRTAGVSQEGLFMEFVPHPDAVLAGGHCRPVTVITPGDRQDSLIVRLYNVVLAGDLAEALPGPSGELPGLDEPSGITRITVRQGAGGPIPGDAARILGEGFPYGHLITDTSYIEEQPVVEIEVHAEALSDYTVEFPMAEEDTESVVRYLLRIR